VTKEMAIVGIICNYIIPFLMTPTIIHPFMGWVIFLLCFASILNVMMSVFKQTFPSLIVTTPWLPCVEIFKILMVSSILNNGIFQTICIAFYIPHCHLHFRDGFSKKS